MKISLPLFCTGIMIFASGLVARAKETPRALPPEYSRIVLLGDSITDGLTYPLLLEQAMVDADYQKPILINAGIGGYSTYFTGNPANTYKPLAVSVLNTPALTVLLEASDEFVSRIRHNGYAAPPEPKVELTLPANARFINGTGQLPILGATFKAPGFTSQDYIEITENAGPPIYFVSLNASERTLTIHSAYRTAPDAPLVRITYAARNKKLGLPDNAEQTTVAPWQSYIFDAMPFSVKAGDRLILRTSIPLNKDTNIGCGIISVSEAGWDNGLWPYGNVTSATERTHNTIL